MDQAAHHLDLFFQHNLDPEEVLQARLKEMDLVEDWVRDGYETVAAAAAATRGNVETQKQRSKSTVQSLAPGNMGLLADW